MSSPEFTNVMQLVDARTMLEIGTTAALGASNLAGVVADEGKSLIYTVDRNTGKLYSYSWNAATKTLTLQTGFPKTLANLTNAFGVALDELNGRLFIADGSRNQVEYYSTTTWAHLGSLNVGHYAIGIAVDSANGFVYTGGGWGNAIGLWRWDLATATESFTSNGGIGVMGIAVDQSSHLVYATTGYSGDDLRVFNPDLTLRHTYALPRTYTDSSDGRTYTFSASPTGIVVPGRAVSYNPMNLTKSDGLAPGQTVAPGSNISYTISFTNGNPSNVTGVVVTDTLPPEVNFVSASDGGTLSGNTVTWNIGTVAGGASRSLTLVVQVKPGTPGGTVITNRSSIDCDQTGPAYATEDTTVAVTNQPPVANAGPDQTVEQTSLQGAQVTLNGSGSTDDGNIQPLSYSWTWTGGSASGVSPTVSLPLGQTTVTLTVNDGQFSASDTVVITVRDTTPPVLTVPANVTVEQATRAGTVVPLTATATDICDAAPAVTSDARPIYPLGTTTVTFTATDATGNRSTGSMTVTVVDTTAPQVTLGTSVTTLWPPNHDMIDVGLALSVSDICDARPAVVLSVTQDEKVDEDTGEGNFSPDAKILRDGSGNITGLALRAERKGNGDGRVYLITARVTDASGNVTVKHVAVTVGKSQAKKDLDAVAAQAAAAVAAGVPLPYDSTAGPVIGPKQ